MAEAANEPECVPDGSIPANGRPLKVGVVADTHNILNETARRELRGVDMILHAGDVVDPAILDDLSQIAPVRAVRGNCDYYEPTYRIHVLRETLQIQLGGYRIFVVHKLPEANPSLMPPAFYSRWKEWNPRVAVFGHTHRPEKVEKNGILFFNPGSPSRPRRSRASIGILHLWPDEVVAEHIVVD
ncbi:MAG TPA: metallophosphoesterase [Verrucomicrobiota bacterium]|nr:metallophosphoesterase [Verrucomicrobiota bacterium]